MTIQYALSKPRNFQNMSTYAFSEYNDGDSSWCRLTMGSAFNKTIAYLKELHSDVPPFYRYYRKNIDYANPYVDSRFQF